jgi:hypothetical protein
LTDKERYSRSHAEVEKKILAKWDRSLRQEIPKEKGRGDSYHIHPYPTVRNKSIIKDGKSLGYLLADAGPYLTLPSTLDDLDMPNKI